jgi:hypothetical protein
VALAGVALERTEDATIDIVELNSLFHNLPDTETILRRMVSIHRS